MEICLLYTHYVTLNYIELTYLGTCTHARAHTCTHTHKQTHEHTHAHTCTQHTHTHTLYSLFMCCFVKSSASLYVYSIERKIWVLHMNNFHRLCGLCQFDLCVCLCAIYVCVWSVSVWSLSVCVSFMSLCGLCQFDLCLCVIYVCLCGCQLDLPKSVCQLISLCLSLYQLDPVSYSHRL